MTPETLHLLNVLRSTIRVLDYSFNDVAQKMGVGSGYLSRLFAGKIELKVDHVIDIARAIGFEPAEIFHLAFPRVKEPRSAALQQYLRLTAVEPVPPGEPLPNLFLNKPGAVIPDDVDTAVARALQRIFAQLAKDQETRDK